MSDNIQIVGIADFTKQLAQYADQVEAALIKQLAASGQQMEEQARANLASVGAVDTKELLSNTKYRAADNGKSAEVAAPNPVAAAVEFGTAPAGALRQHMPPSDALEAWGVRHGFPPGSGYLIARKIALQGIKARPWLSKAHDTIAPKFLTDLAYMLNKLRDDLSSL